MRRPPAARATIAVVAVALLAACTPAPPAPATDQRAQQATVVAPEPTPTPTCEPAPLDRRAAAVLVVGLPGVTAATDPVAVEVMEVGVGGVFISEPNIESAEQLAALVAGLREGSDHPLLVSTDEESGRVAVTREVVGAGPSPRRLAQERTPTEVRDFASGIGTRLAELGINWDLAPVLDLDDGPAGGIIGDRAFGADPATVTDYGLAFAAGLDDAGVTPTVKHFPGHGRSSSDSHSELGVVDTPVEELRRTDLLPFQAAIDAGAPVVMLNHLHYDDLDPGIPASVSPKAYALLRDMGFEGVAITDSVGMGPVHSRWDFPQAAVLAISAGADAVLTTDGREAAGMRDALVAAVRDGTLPEERLDEAAARMTALAGGDPVQVACLDIEVPQLRVP